MNLTKSQGGHPTGWSSTRLFVVVIVAVSAALTGQNPLVSAPSRITQPTPGGIDPRPVVLSIAKNKTNGQMRASCAGFQGGPFQMLYRTNATTGAWTPVGPAFGSNSFTVDLPSAGDKCFYAVQGPPPAYGGADLCSLCHAEPGPYDTWIGTKHANAYNNLPAFAQNSSGCVPCHTVGFGFPSGYTVGGNPALQGVQCENCHGPGGNSAATAHSKPSTAFRRPDVELNAMLCGGCHTDIHHPTFDEWETAGHARVSEAFSGSQATSCGRCHIGSARLAMLKGETPSTDPADLNVGVVCVVCHEPHGNTTNVHLLRNPLFSTNYYNLTTSTNLLSAYDPNVQICGQCHNARGAAWDDINASPSSRWSRPPHHSPQYNLLVANLGVWDTNAFVLRASVGSRTNHWALSDQCVHCHMQTVSLDSPTEKQPNDTGHGFKVKSFEACMECHVDPEFSMESVQSYVSERISEVKMSLDQWATTKAPAVVRTNYGVLAWEYTTPGAISLPEGVTNVLTPSGTWTNKGPTTALQAQVPNNIKQARFNLYLVLHDGSGGVHNAAYADYLIGVAEDKVKAELAR